VAYADQRANLRMAQRTARRQDNEGVAIPTSGEMRLACAASTTSRLRQYGSRVDTTSTWSELVLDKDTLDAVQHLARFAQVRDKLFDEWGFGRLMQTGRALSAMFSGPSGTGKTMVAGLIAKDLGVELYRVDLSRVMSKYIGETEERLGALFSEASQVGAALLFDEADSLFGQRTEIKSSNDRYANLEVNYLLQRLEEFDGVVILTTNFGSSIDDAFLRRLRFRVQFPFPSPKERARLWDVLLPREMPQDDEGLDVDWMGEAFELTGGHVRNAVLRAAMYAAEGQSVDGKAGLSMRMLYDAAAAEYRELGKLAPAYPFDD
jgi:SpoVK/Ycf46/Vps4 family AAA+-type ATPase